MCLILIARFLTTNGTRSTCCATDFSRMRKPDCQCSTTVSQRAKSLRMQAKAAVKKITANHNKAKAALLAANIETFMAPQKLTQIEKIAPRTKVDKCRTLRSSSTPPRTIKRRGHRRCKMPLTHMKTMELNEGTSYHATFKTNSNYFRTGKKKSVRGQNLQRFNKPKTKILPSRT